MKVLNFINSTNWKFHRNGWKYVIFHLKKEFHNKNGMPFYDWVDGEFRKRKPIKHEWGGILHNVIHYPPEYYLRKDIKILSLNDLVEQNFFLQSMKKCKFLFTLSPTTAKFLRSKGFLAHSIFHACPTLFNWKKFNKKVLTIGQWMRKIETISEIKTNFQKIIIKVPWKEPYENLKLEYGINFINYLNSQEYDMLMSNSVIFLNMYDVAACNTILECIMGNVPILINRLSGSEDYLGKDYPFFYDSIEEASFLLSEDNIFKSHYYLKNKDKSIFSIKNMTSSIDSIIKKFYYQQTKIF